MSTGAARTTATVGSTEWTVDSRYQPLKTIGSGAYGVVCSALDRKSNNKVAIKKIAKAFEIVTIAKRTLLEIKLLGHFHKHDNIIAIETILQPPPPPAPFRDVYVVMELLESDLHRIIYSKQDLTEEHVRYFLYQTLRGLRYIHSAKVLHRDIKPGNLLLTSNCDLKICDFGMARVISSNPEEHAGFMTAYVATRWYRAPEVMLSFREYTYAIDVWSVACIFAEMLGRRHLFPGRNYVEQLNLILKYLGVPSESCIQRIGSQMAQKYLRSLKSIKSPNLHNIYPKASADAVDLLAKMLCFDPDERCTVDDALAHPFLRKYHDPTDEPECASFDFDFAGQDALSPDDIRESILAEIASYHRTKKRGAADVHRDKRRRLGSLPSAGVELLDGAFDGAPPAGASAAALLVSPAATAAAASADHDAGPAGGAADASVGVRDPVRVGRSAGLGDGTDAFGGLDMAWLDHVDDQWLHDSSFQTELENGVSTIFTS